jgi:hypothetical protein
LEGYILNATTFSEQVKYGRIKFFRRGIMAKQKTGNTFLEEQIGYVEQEICKK